MKGKTWAFALTLTVVAMNGATANHIDRQKTASYDLVQPKMREMIATANNALSQGDYEKALAYTNLVLLKDEVKYSVDLSLIPDAQRATAKAAASEAVALWKDALGDEIEFTEVEPKKARIRITFEQDIRSMGDAVAGHAVWTRQVNDWGGGRYSRVLTGDIRLRTKTPTGRDMGKDAMVHSAAHELGHLLGLWDSPDFGDIMGPLHLKQPVTTISDKEIGALKDARAIAHTIAESCHEAKSRF